VAALYKRLAFAGIKIVRLAEGEISELHVGLKGTMNALFLKDLALKTHRGLEGRVRQGRSAGGRVYGYAVVREADARGEPIRGGRAINEAEAAVVRRIFQAFAVGRSPAAIARALNAQDVAGPDGRPWQGGAITGHSRRRNGILRNELYIGRRVWNRQHFVKDPVSGKRIPRVNLEAAWIVEPAPELRIVEDALWQAVAARLEETERSPRVRKLRASRFWERRRPGHLLTGLVRCGRCGGREANRQRREQEVQTEHKRRELAEVTRRLDGLAAAIEDGLRTPGLKERLEGLEHRQAALQAELAEETPPAPRLHPNLAELYWRKVTELAPALEEPTSRDEAIGLLRGLVERVELHPTAEGLDIEVTGAIAGMIALPSPGEGFSGRGLMAIMSGLRSSTESWRG
jgi:hypothetical protein